jgi:hypothetical protein
MAERPGQLAQLDRYFAAATIAHEHRRPTSGAGRPTRAQRANTSAAQSHRGEFARGRPRARRAPAASGFAHRKGRRRGTHVASSTASPPPSMLPRVRTAPRARSSQRSAKRRRSGASRDAPREIRTPTAQTGHKALNLPGGVRALSRRAACPLTFRARGRFGRRVRHGCCHAVVRIRLRGQRRWPAVSPGFPQREH